MSIEEPMSIEDLVRTATRAGATLVRDIRPLAAPEPSGRRGRPRPASRRWRSWGVPLAAAAAVALVAVTLVAVRGADSGAPAAHPATPTGPTTVPRYYVAPAGLDNADGIDRLLIGDDVTGKAIATVKAPPGTTFVPQLASGAADDDRTFVVATEPDSSRVETWYLLRIAPGAAHPYRLTKLPIKLPGAAPRATPFVAGYALSADGRQLAIETEATSSDLFAPSLRVYSVPSGAELHAWTSGEGQRFNSDQATLTWLAGGRQLAFDVAPQGAAPENQLRLLDLTGAGSNLMADSRALLTVTTPMSSPSECGSLTLTPDGGTGICGTLIPRASVPTCAHGGLAFTAYSVRTGKPVRSLYQYQAAASCLDGDALVRWTDSSASTIIGAVATNIYAQQKQPQDELGVITDGRIRLLKLPPTLSPAAYPLVQF